MTTRTARYDSVIAIVRELLKDENGRALYTTIQSKGLKTNARGVDMKQMKFHGISMYIVVKNKVVKRDLNSIVETINNNIASYDCCCELTYDNDQCHSLTVNEKKVQ